MLNSVSRSQSRERFEAIHIHTNTHTLYMASSWRKSYLYSLYSLFRVAEILRIVGREPRYKIFLLFAYQCYCNKFNMLYKIWTHTNTCLTEMYIYADTHRLTRVFTNIYIYPYIYGWLLTFMMLVFHINGWVSINKLFANAVWLAGGRQSIHIVLFHNKFVTINVQVFTFLYEKVRAYQNDTNFLFSNTIVVIFKGLAFSTTH